MDDYAALEGKGVQLLVRDFPLDSSCNSLLQSGEHHAACAAAILARYAKKVLSEEEATAVSDWLHSRGQRLTQDEVETYIKTRGFESDIAMWRPKLLLEIDSDIREGWVRGVRATPTVFIDGVKLPNYVYLEIALNSLRGRR